MRTYLQEKLTGREGQVVGFGPGGRAEAQDLSVSVTARVRITVVRNGADGDITFTAACGVRKRVGVLPAGQTELVMDLGGYGTWTIDAAEPSGRMIGTHRELVVDDIREYHIGMGVEEVLSDNPPAIIHQAALVGAAPFCWNLGDEVQLPLTGGDTVTIAIYDFDHDTLTEGGRAPITFGIKVCSTHTKHQTDRYEIRSWTDSEPRSYLNGAGLKLLPPEWQRIIRPVTKLTGSGKGNRKLVATQDKLFLFSQEEIFGHRAAGCAEGEGRQYPVCVSENSRVRKDSAGEAVPWWLRTPIGTSETEWRSVDHMGKEHINSSSLLMNLVFGFCV